MSKDKNASVCNELVNKYAPSISRSMLVQAIAQAMGNAAHNASFTHQQQNLIINTNTALSAGILHSIGSAYAKK